MQVERAMSPGKGPVPVQSWRWSVGQLATGENCLEVDDHKFNERRYFLYLFIFVKYEAKLAWNFFPLAEKEGLALPGFEPGMAKMLKSVPTSSSLY